MSNSEQQIEQDIQLMIGGGFTPDSLGPSDYAATIARAQAQASAYLETFESLYMGVHFDALRQSNLHADVLLRIVRDVEPELTRAVINRLLNQYNAVLVLFDSLENKEALLAQVPEDMQRLSVRLDRRRANLRDLIGS